MTSLKLSGDILFSFTNQNHYTSITVVQFLDSTDINVLVLAALLYLFMALFFTC